MKFATYSDGSRDGELLLVSRDLQTAVYTAGIASKLQQVLDDWNFLAPQLQALYDALNHGRVGRAFAFDPARCMAPMPRAFEVLALEAGEGATGAVVPLRGSALQGPSQPVCTGLSADTPVPTPISLSRHRAVAKTVTLDHDGASDGGTSIGPLQASLGWVAVLGDVAPGAGALDAVRLLMAAQRWSVPGATEACLALSFAPLALTPDEWGDDWLAGTLHARLLVGPAGVKLPALKQARPLQGPAPGALAQGIAQASRYQALGSGAMIWCAFDEAVPEFACLARDNPHQWSVLPRERTLGFGVCTVPVDPQSDPCALMPVAAASGSPLEGGSPVTDPDAQSAA